MVLILGWPRGNDPRPDRADVPPCGGGLRGGGPCACGESEGEF